MVDATKTKIDVNFLLHGAPRADDVARVLGDRYLNEFSSVDKVNVLDGDLVANLVDLTGLITNV